MRRVLCILALFAASATGGFAHEIRPAYLELRQTAPETYDVLWKVPGQGETLRFGLYVEFPVACTNLTPPRGSMLNNAYTERWTVQCPGGLSGGTIHIAGLSGTVVDVLVRLERLDGTAQVTRLTPSAPSLLVEAAPRQSEVARTYIVLGVEHILSGIDHLLFVLALIFICLGPGATARTEVLRLSLDTRHWTLLKTVTAFTISHSITLTLATLGYVHIPQRPVEASIALSIVFVAAEIVHGQRGRMGLTSRAPWIVALTFGLMHGLGFASGLSDAGLPDGHIPTALLFFSIGVELGHFLFIGAVLSLFALARRVRLPTPQWSKLIPPYAIGAMAMFWVIQRIADF
ncbi:MAG: HupE/UreJ family protein [Lentisphaerae bacterium]|nr:HupE/UreJ family protein [Lentisphaerota bacterium]